MNTTKVALITGGSSGIGLSVAKKLYADGYTVILQAQNKEKLKTAAIEVGSDAKRIGVFSTNLTQKEDVLVSAELIIEKYGVPHLIINSAGSGEWLSFEEASLDHFSETMNSPYIATALTCKVFYDKMKSRGNGQFIIVNSAASFFSFPGAMGYGPARWAMLGFSNGLQADLAGTEYKVSAVVLGKVDSPYFKNNPISESKVPRISNILVPTMTVDEAGQVVFDTVKSKRKMVIKPTIMAVFVFFNRLFPRVFNQLMQIK